MPDWRSDGEDGCFAALSKAEFLQLKDGMTTLSFK
jgi:hypothetical protein